MDVVKTFSGSTIVNYKESAAHLLHVDFLGKAVLKPHGVEQLLLLV